MGHDSAIDPGNMVPYAQIAFGFGFPEAIIWLLPPTQPGGVVASPRPCSFDSCNTDLNERGS